MNVYTAAMDLPKECVECQFNIPDKDGYPQCVILHRFIIDGNTFSNCPLGGIVTCRECKKHGKNSCPMTFTYTVITDDNDYCSYAERRTI